MTRLIVVLSLLTSPILALAVEVTAAPLSVSALAASVAAAPTDDLLVQIANDFLGGRFSLATVGLLILVVGLARKVASPRIPVLAGDVGGTVFGLALGTLGTLSGPLAAGTPFSKSLIAVAIGQAWAASGGWTTVRRTILTPLLQHPWVNEQIRKATKGIPLGGPILKWLLSRYLAAPMPVRAPVPEAIPPSGG
jgi:hypothetical protein